MSPFRSRYSDVQCLDSTRVVLKGRGEDDDYIHANWVRLPGESRARFICTQGPTDDTLVDFWHMVFEERCSCIVMLCRCQEEGVDKCAEYFPARVEDPAQPFGEYEVQMLATQRLDHHVTRSELQVRKR